MNKATETKTQKIVMKNDGLHIIGQSLAKPITIQVTNMDDELITSIDTDGNDSIGITQDGYKVFVNGKLLGIENSSTNEWVPIENYFSKLLLVDLSGFERMYLFPFEEIDPLYPLILPCFAWL